MSELFVPPAPAENRDCLPRETADGRGMHFIRVAVLEKLALEHMQKLVSALSEYEEEFARVGRKTDSDLRRELASKRRVHAEANRRMAQLDQLLRKMW